MPRIVMILLAMLLGYGIGALVVAGLLGGWAAIALMVVGALLIAS